MSNAIVVKNCKRLFTSMRQFLNIKNCVVSYLCHAFHIFRNPLHAATLFSERSQQIVGWIFYNIYIRYFLIYLSSEKIPKEIFPLGLSAPIDLFLIIRSLWRHPVKYRIGHPTSVKGPLFPVYPTEIQAQQCNNYELFSRQPSIHSIYVNFIAQFYASNCTTIASYFIFYLMCIDCSSVSIAFTGRYLSFIV